jgi:formylglycine-generating enzyme required for sulfatase activity
VHRVTLRHLFLLGRYPVTRGEYAAFARDTGRTPEPPDFEQTDRHPAVNVAFADAVAYTEWLSARTGLHYRLPSEAEWEYACRAGTTTAHYWGDSFDPALANNNDKGTTEAGAYKPNPWGLYDMIGNVFEWVADPWHDDYKGAPKDGSVWTTSGSDGRVVRGGAWFDIGGYHRSGYRNWFDEGSRPWVGFRLASTPPCQSLGDHGPLGRAGVAFRGGHDEWGLRQWPPGDRRPSWPAWATDAASAVGTVFAW